MHSSVTHRSLPFPWLVLLAVFVGMCSFSPVFGTPTSSEAGTETTPAIAPFDRTLLKHPEKTCQAVLGAIKSENILHLIELTSFEQQKFFRDLQKEGPQSEAWQKFFLPKKQLLVKSHSVGELRQGVDPNEVFGKAGGDRSMAFVIILVRSGEQFSYKDLVRMELKYFNGRPRWK